MKRFLCPVCHQPAYFRNTLCLNCGTELVHNPHTGDMVTLQDTAPCANRPRIACNWMAEANGLCESCTTTVIIPDLDVAGNLARWIRVETAKRHLFHSLDALGLPHASPSGKRLRFHFVGDQFAPDGTIVKRMLTGHEEGLITLNIAEADDDERERRRLAMGEPYRTLLGHLRHEIGHFYWEVLVREAGREDECALIFGDARQDYSAALQRHYAEGPPEDWQTSHVSPYATAHPWEDWAETWAHLLHILDGLDTAQDYGLDPSGLNYENPYDIGTAGPMLAAWGPLSTAMNAMNRSLGHNDFYPFSIAPPVVAKLDYMLHLIRDRATLDRTTDRG
ncbi:zinc-binding metallopeptidase family protein [Falsirhodobacter halotolerans]|uniref:zinc-binding metallopeptidase family protein n=1 Tax=Falsirhodobacter halotolerans TaxID=1146892 RepID=UPI001FD028D8|nr:putative zinc-binding metallopeptidase [Falsirhodobacter halotolerans]MCJ8140475.1 putative zinc-binding peptidase [Falsirhodobacter halotolerans]